jgi:hypothetical protein
MARDKNTMSFMRGLYVNFCNNRVEAVFLRMHTFPLISTYEFPVKR